MIEFVLVIAPGDEEAAQINATYRYMIDDSFCGMAVPDRQQVVGLMHRGKRPTRLVISDCEIDAEWFRECIQPMIDRGAVVYDLRDPDEELRQVLRKVSADMKLYTTMDWICDRLKAGDPR